MKQFLCKRREEGGGRESERDNKIPELLQCLKENLGRESENDRGNFGGQGKQDVNKKEK